MKKYYVYFLILFWSTIHNCYSLYMTVNSTYSLSTPIQYATPIYNGLYSVWHNDNSIVIYQSDFTPIHSISIGVLLSIGSNVMDTFALSNSGSIIVGGNNKTICWSNLQTLASRCQTNLSSDVIAIAFMDADDFLVISLNNSGFIFYNLTNPTLTFDRLIKIDNSIPLNIVSFHSDAAKKQLYGLLSNGSYLLWDLNYNSSSYRIYQLKVITNYTSNPIILCPLSYNNIVVTSTSQRQILFYDMKRKSGNLLVRNTSTASLIASMIQVDYSFVLVTSLGSLEYWDEIGMAVLQAREGMSASLISPIVQVSSNSTYIIVYSTNNTSNITKIKITLKSNCSIPKPNCIDCYIYNAINTCYKCAQAYVINGSNCVACASNCSTCIISSLTVLCTSCYQRYFLNTSKLCQPNPCSNQYCLDCSSNNYCYSCSNISLLSNGTCFLINTTINQTIKVSGGYSTNPLTNDTGTILSVPTIRTAIKPLRSLCFFLEDYWYYKYHQKDYSDIVRNIFQEIQYINDLKLTPQFIDTDQYLQMLNVEGVLSSNYSSYIPYKFNQATKVDNQFIINTQEMYAINYPSCIITFIAFKLLFMVVKLLNMKQNKTFRSLKKYLQQLSMYKILIVVLIQSNIMYISFYCGLQLLMPIGQSLLQKLNVIVAQVFLYIVIMYSSCFYIFVYQYCSQTEAEILLTFTNYQLKGFICQTLVIHLRNVINGFINAYFAYNYYSQIASLMAVKIITVMILSYFSQAFNSKFTLTLLQVYFILGSVLDFTFLLEYLYGTEDIFIVLESNCIISLGTIMLIILLYSLWLNVKAIFQLLFQSNAVIPLLSNQHILLSKSTNNATNNSIIHHPTNHTIVNHPTNNSTITTNHLSNTNFKVVNNKKKKVQFNQNIILFLDQLPKNKQSIPFRPIRSHTKHYQDYNHNQLTNTNQKQAKQEDLKKDQRLKIQYHLKYKNYK